MADQKNNNQNAPDVLSYNTSGLPLSLAAFFMTKDECIKRMESLASQAMGGDFKAKIEVFRNNDATEYDPDVKSNYTPNEVSFQIWVPKSNPSITVNSNNADNPFMSGSSAPLEYTQEFKKFVNSYGLADEKGNVYNMIGKSKKDKLVVCLDPVKLFSLFVDLDCRGYNQEFPANKCNRNIEISAKAIYEGENPIDVIHGKRRSRSNNLTGFIIQKFWKSFNNGENDKYRPSFKARKRRYD